MRIAHLDGTSLSPVSPKMLASETFSTTSGAANLNVNRGGKTLQRHLASQAQPEALHVTDSHQSLRGHGSLASTWQFDLAARIQHAEDIEDDETLQENSAVPKVYESDEDIDGDEVMQHVMSSMDAAHSRQADPVMKRVPKASTSSGRGDGESGVGGSSSDCVHDDSLMVPTGFPEYGFMSDFDNAMTLG